MKSKIVIVDDDQFILDLVKLSFEEYPEYEIITVPNALDAEEVIRKERPSLILIDLYMPQLNGLDLGYKLKSHPEIENVPIMFMSAHPTLENAKLAFFLGAVDLIEKPFKPNELVEKARASVEICELRRAIHNYLSRTQ
jgi:DNA-binding response OmpR family regulator